MVNHNTSGELLYNVGLSVRELTELIRLIDDEDELDEELLNGVRKKLVNRRKRLNRSQKAIDLESI